MSHQVTVQPSGHRFVVEGDATVLSAAIDAGLGLPYGCRNGACGACKGKVLQGEVSHNDHQASALTDADKANGLALLCCAVPQTDLVIECREATGSNGIRPRAYRRWRNCHTM